MNIKYPYFIIISGPPATGKTSLGFKLKEHYKIPFIYKDSIKETLYDSLGNIENNHTLNLGNASMVLLYKILEEQLSTENSIILESAFLISIEYKRIKKVIDKYNAVPIEIYCTGSKKVILERFTARQKGFTRHNVHKDQYNRNIIQDLRERLNNGSYGYLGLNENRIILNKDNFSTISIEKLIKEIDGFIRN